jgi:hypothetical protein
LGERKKAVGRSQQHWQDIENQYLRLAKLLRLIGAVGRIEDSEPRGCLAERNRQMKAYLHIGGEKTGTTTVQEFCRVNRSALAELGFLYPVSLGASNHLKLAAYALDDDNFDDDTRKFLGLRSAWDLKRFRAGVERDLARELEAAAPSAVTILSNELIQSRLVKAEELTRLKALLNGLFSQITIVFYLRRQDRVAVSHYSTRLKSDSDSTSSVFPEIKRGQSLPRYFDYNTTLIQLEDVFGKENINVRLFESEFFKGGDLLADFRAVCGIPDGPALLPVDRENESLSPSAITFYKHFNKVVPRFVSGAPNPIRLGLNAAMSKEFSGRGPEVSADMARTFYGNFLPGNREISQRYFPNGDPNLFSTDFSMYNASITTDDDLSKLPDIATHLWVERSMEIERLKLENYFSRFLLGISKQPKKLVAPPASTGVGALTPAHLAAQWLGALLYVGENERAIESARVLETSKSMPVYIVARLFATLRLGDLDRLEGEIAHYATGTKIESCISYLRISGTDCLKEEAMTKMFQDGDPLCQQVYKRIFEWIELS